VPVGTMRGTLAVADQKRTVRISKLLSLALRHDPSALGLQLDANGWVEVQVLLHGLAAHGAAITLQELQQIVAGSDKQRFALSGDGTRVRANQGHSVPVDLGLAPLEPPTILYHGTVARFVDAIRGEGLVRGSRMFVHLSADIATAKIVAGRRRGPAVILTVQAGDMHREGYAFYRSENGVWLTESVPSRFLIVPA
jgi:putative RNA 2'-phosphotransferase